MTYVQGGLIEAADFNAMRTQALVIYGVGNGNSGYGQTTVTVPTVAGGQIELVKSVEWTALRTVIDTCATHQNTVVSLPPPAQLTPGSVIKAYPPASGDIPGALTAINTNRLNAATGSLSTLLAQLTSTRATSWQTQLVHEFSVTFTTFDAARYFFNSGGQIILRPSRSGGSGTPQNSAWDSFISAFGTIVLNHTTTVSSLGVGTTTNVGYYDLPVGTYTTLWSYAYGGITDYSANNILVEGRVTDGPGGANADNGKVLNIKITYNDVHTGTADVVDGTFTSNVDIKVATTPLTIAVPSYANITLLTAGT